MDWLVGERTHVAAVPLILGLVLIPEASAAATTPPRRFKRKALGEDSAEKSAAVKQEQPVEDSKKKKKSYDVVANQNGLLLKIGNQLSTGVSKQLVDVIQECSGNVQTIDSTFSGDELSFFKDYRATVEARQEIATALQAHGENSTKELRDLIEKQRSEYRLSIDDLGDLTTLEDAVLSLKQAAREAQTEDDIKQVAKRLKDTVATFKRVVAAVNRAASDLKRAGDQKVKKAEADIVKKRKQDEAKQKKDIKEIQKKMKQGNNGDGPLPGLWVPGPMTEKLCQPLLVYESLEALKKEFKASGSNVFGPGLG